MERVDVVIVGGGVMGSATARSLGRRGVRTVLLERFRVGHARGSSHGATRIFRLAYPHRDYVRLARRALDGWRSLQEDAGEELLVRTGGLDTGPTADDCGAALAAAGIEHRWLTQVEATDRFPAIAFDGFERVLFQPDAGVCLAERTVAAQVRIAARAGVEVREETEVLGIEPSADGVLVSTKDGELEGNVVVVTAGPWAGPLLGGIVGATSLTPTLQHLAYFEPREPGVAEGMPTFIEWLSPTDVWYAVPPAGTAPGAKAGEHRVGPVVDPAEGPFDVDPSALGPIAAYVERRLPGLRARPVAPETCLYTMTPDEDFVVDRVGKVVVGAGFSGHGFKFAPLIGEALAALALGEDPGLPPGRFSVPRGSPPPG